MERFTENQIREYNDAFCMFDRQNKGYILSIELREMLKTIGFNPTDKDLENLHWESILRKTTAKTIISSESKQRPQYKTKIKAITEEEIPGMVIIPTKN